MNGRKISVGPFVLATVVAICLGGCAPSHRPAKQKPTDTTTTPDDTTTPVSETTASSADSSAKQPPTPAEERPATEPAEKENKPTEAAPESAKTAPEQSVAPSANNPAEITPAKPDGEPQPESPAPPAKDQATSTPNSGNRVVSGDWPMWAGTMSRNMVNPTTGISLDFQPAEDAKKGKHLLWVSSLGSQTYGNPVVAQGKVYVGTNNGGNYRPKHKGDRGVVLCFDEKTGEFLWQLTREKLPQGRVNDWPEQGICSTVAVDGDRAYVVTNRCELVCLDVNGFYDGKNDGPYQDEPDTEKGDADIVWILDMMETLGVFPHNMAASSPVVYGDYVYLHTSNGVDESHLEIPSPRAPSFIAVNKKTGEVAWESNAPFDKILHGQWSSPSIGLVKGQAQVYFAGGNGWLYALDAKTGEEIWKFDLNPKDAKYELGGRGTRNYVIATPVFYENSVLLATGQDPEHGDGVGHLWRIDATKKGDVSAVTPDNKPNPNSAMIWHRGGVDTDGSVTGKKGEDIFRRTLSTVGVHDGLVFAADLSGRVHCLDLGTGKRYWEADVMAAIWGSTLVVDGKVFVGNEDGVLTVFAAGKELKKLKEFNFPSSIYSTPTIANGVMFVSDRSRLYAISTQ
ncbi:MAG: PQQ-binding-like beta-propeller repeat protein [Planctomycetota bacterium]|nr:PQQ-binding-like beta-propeller repeat protein [Planctomycetota bacterium]